ncbi:MAG: hypothetical protein JSU99_09070, partial [Nitrospiraceae bacterium]
MVKKILLGLVLGFVIVALTSITYASEGEVVLKVLLKKGIITQAEYNDVMKELKGESSIDRRVEEVEKESSQLAEEQENIAEEHKAFAEHTDKHIV